MLNPLEHVLEHRVLEHHVNRKFGKSPKDIWKACNDAIKSSACIILLYYNVNLCSDMIYECINIIYGYAHHLDCL